MAEKIKNSISNLGQRRAAHAWRCVQDCSRDYTVLAKSAPALIMSNGLMPTLAFYASKKKGHHKDLLEHLVAWLKTQFPKIADCSFDATISYLHSAESSDYRRATEEALELLRWIRQFAPAVSGDTTAE